MTSSENLKPVFVSSSLAGTIGSVKDVIIRFIRKELLGEGAVSRGKRISTPCSVQRIPWMWYLF